MLFDRSKDEKSNKSDGRSGQPMDQQTYHKTLNQSRNENEFSFEIVSLSSSLFYDMPFVQYFGNLSLLALAFIPNEQNIFHHNSIFFHESIRLSIV